MLTAPADMDDPAAVEAEAAYWELPVAYRETRRRRPGSTDADGQVRGSEDQRNGLHPEPAKRINGVQCWFPGQSHGPASPGILDSAYGLRSG